MKFTTTLKQALLDVLDTAGYNVTAHDDISVTIAVPSCTKAVISLQESILSGQDSFACPQELFPMFTVTAYDGETLVNHVDNVSDIRLINILDDMCATEDDEVFYDDWESGCE